MKEVLSPKEAAKFLNLHVRTVYRLAKKGEIPGRKIGGSWRFKKDVLEKLISAKGNLTFSLEREEKKRKQKEKEGKTPSQLQNLIG